MNTVRESVTTVTNWAVYQVQRPFRYIFTQDAEDVEVNNTQDANITQEQDGLKIIKSRRLLGDTVGHYHTESQGITSPRDFLNRVRNTVVRFFGEHTRNKIRISLICDMERVNPATGLVTDDLQTGFNSEPESIFASTDLEETYQRMLTKVLESFAKYLKNGSGWRLKRVVRLNITVSKLRPLKGSSYIPLPKFIARSKGLIRLTYRIRINNALSGLLRELSTL